MTDAELASFLASGAQAYGKSAYMLVYERKSKKNLHEVILDGNVAEEADKEETTPIDFRTVPRYVPEGIQKEVLEDNKNFLIDAQMFHDDFFENMITGVEEDLRQDPESKLNKDNLDDDLDIVLDARQPPHTHR